MADRLLILVITLCLICCTLLSGGDGLAGFVPLHSGKVGVPLTPTGFVPHADDVTVEEGDMVETAASDLESEASLEDWEDESQEDGEQRERAVYVTGGASRRTTYWDVMLARVAPHGGGYNHYSSGRMHPADIGLSMIPTGRNRTDSGPVNGTEKTRKILCVGRDAAPGAPPAVMLVNNTGLLALLGIKNDSTAPNCAVVMFYAPWCPFCSRTAPHYNALARAFPQMNVLAIDAVHFSNLNARFGTVAVPNILVFHNAKAVARFNASMRTLDFMVEFVSNTTGLTPVPNITVEEWDLQGPLSSQPTQEPDYLLALSWAFNIFFFLYVFSKSSVGQRIWNNFATFGREPEHQHID